MRIFLAASLALLSGMVAAQAAPSASAPTLRTSLAMHGDAALPDDFTHFPYANLAAPKGGTLKLAEVGTFDSLNPFIIKGDPAVGLRLTFESLMARSADEPFSLYPQIAHAYEMPDDRSWIIFYLDTHARFHDGTPVTAEDVKFSLETLRDKGRPNHRSYYRRVAAIKVMDEHTIKLTFDGTGDRELPLILALLPVLPKHVFENRDFEETTLTPIPGTGPYEIAVVEEGTRIVYQRRADYWGKDLPSAKGRHNVDRIVIDYYRDRAAARLAVQKGDVDVWQEQDPAQWQQPYGKAEASGALRRLTPPAAIPYPMRALVFNTRRPLFEAADIRGALARLFDAEELNRLLFNNAYVRTDSFFAGSELAYPARPGNTRSAPPTQRQRLRRAMDTFRRNGWWQKDGQMVQEDGTPVTFEVLLGNPRDVRIVQLYAATLRRIGITLMPRLVDSAQYLQRTNDYDFDLIIYEWQNSLSPGNEQGFYWGSEAADTPGTRNYMGVKDPRIDFNIDRLTRATTREELIRAAKALDGRLMRGHFIIPLLHKTEDWYVLRRNVKVPEKIPAFGLQLDTVWIDGAN